MSANNLPKATIASFPFWKALVQGVFLSAGIVILSGGFRFIVGISDGFTLEVWNIALGGAFLIIGLFNWWVWHWHGKRAPVFRWWTTLAGNLFVAILLLSAGLTCWNALLMSPWNWIVNGILILIFVWMLVLPALSTSRAKSFSKAQDVLSAKMLMFGGAAALMLFSGIVGASVGLSRSVGSILFLFAFLLPVFAIGLVQYSMTRLWLYRPWQKERA